MIPPEAFTPPDQKNQIKHILQYMADLHLQWTTASNQIKWDLPSDEVTDKLLLPTHQI